MKPTARRLFLALALSAAVHVLAAVGFGWQLPEEPVPVMVSLDARLSTPRREARKIRSAAPAPAPPQSPAQEPLPQAGVSEPEVAAPDPETQPAVMAQSTAPAPSTPATQSAAAPGFPRRSRLQFSVFRGDRGLLIGHCVQAWQSDGKHYRIESHTSSAGVVAMFKTLKLSQQSIGEVDEAGLRPRQFRTERDGKLTEEAEFRWESSQLALRSGDTNREVTLTPGAQDVLSLFYQTALTWRGDETITVNVATGKSFNTYRLVKVGEALVPTRLGRLVAVHLRREAAPGDDGVDIWLGRDVDWLPVRIRFTDRKGDVYDQRVEDIEIDGRPAVLPLPGKAQTPDTEIEPAPG